MEGKQYWDSDLKRSRKQDELERLLFKSHNPEKSNKIDDELVAALGDDPELVRSFLTHSEADLFDRIRFSEGGNALTEPEQQDLINLLKKLKAFVFVKKRPEDVKQFVFLSEEEKTVLIERFGENRFNSSLADIKNVDVPGIFKSAYNKLSEYLGD